MPRFTFHRLWAIVLKEFIQMRRDRVTFGMMVGIPLMQALAFRFRDQFRPEAPAHRDPGGRPGTFCGAPWSRL